MAKTKETKVQIKLVRSLIGCSEAQRKVAKALGFTKKNQVVEHSESATIMGMVNKVPHIVSIVD